MLHRAAQGGSSGETKIRSQTATHLGGPQGETARLTVEGVRGALKAGGIGHITLHVIRLQFEGVRRAVGETLLEEGEALVHFMLAIGVAQRAKDAYGLVAGPDQPAWGRVAVE